MKQLHIFLFITSLLFSFAGYGQEVAIDSLSTTPDSLKVKERYGLRIGLDIFRPALSYFEDDYTSLGFVADMRIKNNYYVAVEFGTEEKTKEEDYLNFTTKGSYIKIGGNYNAYLNWEGMTNEIYIGARYAFSSFDQTLNSYTPNASGTYFESDPLEPNTKFTDLSAHWLEIVLGMKVETFKNLYLGLGFSINKMMSTKEPENFKNLHVPGFNRVFANDVGVGFQYTLSYQIPLITKNK